MLIKSAAGSIFNAEQAHMMGVATDLARGKMYDIEEKLLKDGFTDTDQSQTSDKAFDDEGWPTIYYAYKVEQVELPSWDELQALAQGHATNGTGSAADRAFGDSAFGALGARRLGSSVGRRSARATRSRGFQNSALGGMLGMIGGGSAAAAELGRHRLGAQGGAFIQSQYRCSSRS